MRAASAAGRRRERAVRRAAGDLPAAWRARVTANGCQVCPRRGGDCDGPVHGHHVVRQQAIERHVEAVAHELGLTLEQEAEMLARLLWDPRNGMGACERAHRRHHNRVEPIPLGLVPASVLAFAAEHGLARHLDEYPAEALA